MIIKQNLVKMTGLFTSSNLAKLIELGEAKKKLISTLVEITKGNI